MNWDALGALGEIAGAIGVIVPLWRTAIDDPSSLSNDQAVQFEFLVRNYANNLYKLFRLCELGAFPEAEWNLFAIEAKQFFAAPAAREFRENNQLFKDLCQDIDARSSQNLSFLNRPSIRLDDE